MRPRPPRTEPLERRERVTRTGPAARKGRAARKGPRAREGPAARTESPSSSRVQKLLSAAGVASRREVERWIREGRLQVNGEVPALGARLAARDRITLDGRPVRLHAPKSDRKSVV